MNKVSKVVIGLATLALVGCGSTTKTYETVPVEENSTEGIVNSEAVIIENGTYVEYGDDAVIVHCEGGNCDTYLGVDIDNSDNSDNSVVTGSEANTSA